VVPIVTENLSASYDGRNYVWKDISITIDKPGLVGILGPNGVGKSTFMYTLNKILEPRGGHVYLGGKDVAEMDYKDVAKMVAYVPQSSEETFSMSVMDTVLMGRYPVSGFGYSDDDIRIAANCLDLMKMSDLAMRPSDELSAGQHQKMMIARGLAQEPDILMLDEPTANLDVYYQMYVMKILHEIAHKNGIIVLTICHDLNIASRFCDRLILFSDGKVHSDGTPEEVITEENIREVYGVSSEVHEVDGRPYAVFHSDDSVDFGRDPGTLYKVGNYRGKNAEPEEKKTSLFGRFRGEDSDGKDREG
jgi:iron complex transport system ATP-binding protein